MKKLKFTHSTRRCPFDDLQNEIRQAVPDFIKSKKLGNIERMTMHCFETTTDFTSWPWGKLQRYTDFILTPEWFFWGLSGDQVDTSEGCARIKDLSGTIDFENRPSPDVLVVHGINISGFTYDEARIETWRLNIAEDEAGNAFMREIRKAVGEYSRQPPSPRFTHA